MNNNELKIIITEVKKLIKYAGREVKTIYKNNFNFEIKRDNSPVTKADKASDKILLNGLKKYGFPILSEESEDNQYRLKKKYVWIVDSLDGTTDFIQKTGEFSIMVGLIEDKITLLGLVYLPVNNKLYYAIKGRGSYLEINGKTKNISVSKTNKISESRLVVSRNHLRPEDEKAANDMGIFNLKKSGSNGIKMGLIAEGEAEIFYNTTNKMSQWDACAPEIILTEAGGIVTDIEGNKIVYNTRNIKLVKGLVASNGFIHNEIINNLNK